MVEVVSHESPEQSRLVVAGHGLCSLSLSEFSFCLSLAPIISAIHAVSEKKWGCVSVSDDYKLTEVPYLLKSDGNGWCQPKIVCDSVKEMVISCLYVTQERMFASNS